jgi:hypothetical protein
VACVIDTRGLPDDAEHGTIQGALIATALLFVTSVAIGLLLSSRVVPFLRRVIGVRFFKFGQVTVIFTVRLRVVALVIVIVFIVIVLR